MRWGEGGGGGGGGGSPLFFQEELYFKGKPILKDDTLRGHISVLASPVLLHQKFCLNDD